MSIFDALSHLPPHLVSLIMDCHTAAAQTERNRKSLKNDTTATVDEFADVKKDKLDIIKC